MMPNPAPVIHPMILELIDGEGNPYGDANVMVEVFYDGRALLHGPIRFTPEGFVKDATWTLRYAWKNREEPDVAFRLPEVRDADPFTVIAINSVMLEVALPNEVEQ